MLRLKRQRRLLNWVEGLSKSWYISRSGESKHCGVSLKTYLRSSTMLARGNDNRLPSIDRKITLTAFDELPRFAAFKHGSRTQYVSDAQMIQRVQIWTGALLQRQRNQTCDSRTCVCGKDTAFPDNTLDQAPLTYAPSIFAE